MGPRALPVLIVLTSLSLLAAGCGSSTSSNVGAPVKVGGTLTLDGQPLEGAMIVFIPDGSGQQASTLSGSGGRYRLTTRNTGDGAIPGKYKVTVKKASASGGDVPLTPGTPEYDAKMKGMSMGGKGAPPKLSGKSEGGIHNNYTDQSKTPLHFEIPSGGNTSLDIQLKSDGS